jgi:hypothetical protein
VRDELCSFTLLVESHWDGVPRQSSSARLFQTVSEMGRNLTQSIGAPQVTQSPVLRNTGSIKELDSELAAIVYLKVVDALDTIAHSTLVAC